MSYSGAVLRFITTSAEAPMQAEAVYDKWIAILEKISEEDAVFNQWRYAYGEQGVSIDVRERNRVINDAIKSERKFETSYNGTGLISFTCRGDFTPEEKNITILRTAFLGEANAQAYSF